MRGLYSACLLSELGRRFGVTSADFGCRFDLLVGTSTGSILATALAVGVPLSDIQRLYIEHGPKIFPSPSPHAGAGKLWWAARHFKKPSGDASALRSALKQAFGDMTLEQLWSQRRIALCVPTTNLTKSVGKVFKTPHFENLYRDRHCTLVDVCMASSAAPIMMPVALLAGSSSHEPTYMLSDGGLWANNPILVGIVEALDMAKPGQPIDLLSLGTGSQNSGMALSTEDVSKGLMDWDFGIGVLETSLEAQSSAHNFVASKLLPHLKAKVRVRRIDRRSASSQQAMEIGLDRGDRKATETLQSLAQSDADAEAGEDTRTREGELALRSFFTD